MIFATLSVLFVFGCMQQNATHEEGYQPHLALQMMYMQTWTHKLALAIQAENAPLARFYHHELEEINEEIMDRGYVYEGLEVGELTRLMLLPAFEQLEESLKGDNWLQIRADFEYVVRSCNSCHAATGYGFIRLSPAYEVNPFNQNFNVLESD